MPFRPDKWMLLGLLAAQAAFAQSVQIPFRFEYVAQGQATSVGLGGLITFPSVAIGQTSVVTMRLTNTASAVWTLRDASVIGAGFSVAVSPTAIPAGAQGGFPIVFTPTSTATARAVLTVQLEGSNGQTVSPTFSLSGTAGQDNVVIAFLANASANPVTLGAGDTIRMSVAAAGGRQTASVILSNRGATAQPLQDARVTGSDAFDLGGMPLLPANLGPGGELRFFLTFTPTGRGPFQAQLSLTIGGVARVFPLQGELSTANFIYERSTGADFTVIAPDAAIEFAAASVGAPRQVIRIRIRNVGSQAGRINNLTVSGSAFQLVDPPALPISVSAGEAATIAVGFSPREPGAAAGRLAIDDAGFELTGNGLGGRFNLTLLFGETEAPLFENTTALLPNTIVGDKLAFSITVQNAGNQTAAVTSLLVSGTGFSLVRTPALPARLEPGATLKLDAVFAPGALGASDGRFQMDQLSIPLRGVGNPPPTAPSVQFLNVRSQMDALQQPDLGLTLSAAYPYDIAGKLALSFAAENFQDDPAIQFVNGARTVDFRIPAGTTRAVFPNGSQTIRFQTGSSAGVITVAANLTVAGVGVSGGGFTQDITIPASAPRIRVVQIANRTANRVDVVILGASTARSVQRIKLRLNAAPRANLQTTTLTINAEQTFNTWYQSAQSRPLGSQFAVTVRLDIAGDIRAIESITVTLENARGASSAVTAALVE